MARLIQDPQSIDDQGKEIKKYPDGVKIHYSEVHIDDRGELSEMFDPRWKLSDKGAAYAYYCTFRPGIVKGWGLHKKHTDHYFLVNGELEVVLYDDRESSPTYKMVSKVYLSEKKRATMSIPPGVWHASRNIGTKDALLVNFPSELYNHKSPEKYRLPINTHEIPYSFGDSYGW